MCIRDRYWCDWPAYPQLFVIGDSATDQAPVLIPSELSAEVQADMDPPYHAHLSTSGRSLTTTEPGTCLVKYTTSDNIWFDVVKTVSHTNFFYFDLEPREWPIGEELTPGDDQSYAMGFDGVADYVAISESFLNRQTNWTLSLWFKVGDFRPATLYSEGNPDAAFAVNITTNLTPNPQLQIATWNTSAGWTRVVTTNAPLRAGHWQYLTLTYSGGSDTNGNLSVYLDNSTWSTNGLPRVNFDGEPSATMGVLAAQPPVANFFYGKMDQLRVWTTALTADQVRASPNTTLPETAGSLVADFAFDEGQGQVARNAAGDKYATACAGALWCYGRVVPGGQWSGFPGFIHVPPGQTDYDRYNVGRYSYPTEGNLEASSCVFAVNTGQLEVWWAHRSRQADIPAVYYPSQAVFYTNVWPSAAPQIVIASGLGSSGETFLPADDALSFNGSPTNYVMVKNNDALDVGDELTLEAWVKLTNPGGNSKVVSWATTSSGFALGVYTNAVDVEFYTGIGASRHLYGDNQYGAVPANTWTHIAYTFKAHTTNSIITYVNGQPAFTYAPSINEGITRSTSDLYIGRASWRNDFNTLGYLDEVRIWKVARSPEQIAAAWRTRLNGDEVGLVAYYPFARGVDSSVLKDRGPYGRDGTITGATWKGPGHYIRSAGPLVLGSPSIYFQNDPGQYGYNPNEEHALVLGGIAYALRDDLTITNADGYTSDPYVLLDYLDPITAHPKMMVFSVLETNELYSFNRRVVAGNPILPLMPLGGMPLCTSNFSSTFPSPAWCDRKYGWWAVSAGADGGTDEAVMHFYYPMQPGFYFPDEGRRNQYPPGAQVPWLPQGAETNPVPVIYTVSWPEAPLLQLGQTLTKASGGLPEVWGQLSVDVVYQQSTNQPEPRVSVDLFDPVVARGVTLAKEVVDDMTANKLARYDAPSGSYRFPNLSPSLYPRVYWRPTSGTTSGNLMVAGVYEEPLTGDPYLLLNLLEDFEKGQVNAAATGISTDHYNAWTNAVGKLPGTITNIFSTNAYVHAALSARLAEGCGYVTLAFNNSSNRQQVPQGLPVSLAVIQVDTNLYDGTLQVIEPVDVLAEQLSLRHSADFAGHADQCEFRWRWAEPVGGLPPNTDILTAWGLYGDTDVAQGTNEVTIVGASPFTLSDHYFAVQYRSVDHTGPSGTNWSAWTQNLAPGWVKRVMTGINPFLQMLPDMTANPVDTRVTMISQAGGPYEGDVALNMDAVSQAGLIPVYETVFNRAMAFSLLAGLKDDSMNETLLYAASRLRDLYMLLGNEAYADAMDPTLAFPRELSSDTHGGMATSIFPFMNQVPNLLEEELALLRGRDDTLSPNPTNCPPVYNRLIWNFTAGINAGEPAYAYNYNITGNPASTEGTVTAEDAKRLYPQGHGDAWGHYLSAITHYYDLLSYTNFGWHTEPSATLVGSSTTVSTDFFDEQKFAETAAARARTGLAIVKDTFRQRYAEDATGLWTSYTDGDTDRAWGIDGWASRAGQAAYYDWVMANSLMWDSLTNLTQVEGMEGRDLPPEGIQKIDRNSTLELREITASLNDIQSQGDSADGGLNPLGLARNVVPFDIDPTAIDAGKTHFEQIYDRALQAAYNACVAFDQARGASLELRKQYNSATDLAQALAKQETDYKNQLVEIYGYPYADDIGPTGTYPEGYDGPDLINWPIIDLSNILTPAPTGTVMQVQMYTIFFDPTHDWNSRNPTDYYDLTNIAPTYSQSTQTVAWCLADSGLRLMPTNWTGQRRAQGELQNALADYVQQWYALQAKKGEYEQNLYGLEVECEHRQADYTRFPEEWNTAESYLDNKLAIAIVMASLRTAKDLADLLCDRQREKFFADRHITPQTITGMLGPLPIAELDVDYVAVATHFLYNLAWTKSIAAHALTAATEGGNIEQAIYEHHWQTLLQDNTYKSQLHWSSMDTLVHLQSQQIQDAELRAAMEALAQAEQRVQTLAAEGDRVVTERAQVRARAAQRIQMARYGDLAFRIFRDDTLRRYQQTFDLAARYTYLAAKAYDYETGLLQSDTARTPGSKFLEDVVRARAPGKFYTWLGTPMIGGSVGEPGLADILARMKADWDVVKGRFGFNNPETETSRFSLRTELCRISPYAANGDDTWAQKLEDCKVSNLHESSEFMRYCRSFTDTTNVEPGLIIPFSTCVVAGNNYFGHDLAGGDNAYDASHAATKVRSMGVWFTGYTNNFNTNTTGSGLANQPHVYLIPVGEDVMRSPTRNALQLRHWQVLDQAIPLPYNVGGADIDNPDWLPVVDSLREPLAQIRRFASFRAYHDSGQFDPAETCTNGRLVGRSVWNTRWLLIIPGRTLLSDPALGIERFIHGGLGTNGVKDIKIFFQTYSIPGD